LTQSATSAAIAALEARYGIKLFDRVGRGIVLTQTGRDFLNEAREVVARAKAAAQVLDDLAGLKRGSLTLAASQTVANYCLPPRVLIWSWYSHWLRERFTASRSICLSARVSFCGTRSVMRVRRKERCLLPSGCKAAVRT